MLSMRIDCSTITFLFLTSVRYRIQSSVLLNFSPQNLFNPYRFRNTALIKNLRQNIDNGMTMRAKPW
jgi:hypothetical protein